MKPETKDAVLAALARASEAGCSFIVGVPGMGGSWRAGLTPEQVLRLPDDPTAIHAELVGLTKAEYIEWHESQGLVYCSATTAQGRRCRNSIVRSQLLSPEEWKALRQAGGYCPVHGG